MAKTSPRKRGRSAVRRRRRSASARPGPSSPQMDAFFVHAGLKRNPFQPIGRTLKEGKSGRGNSSRQNAPLAEGRKTENPRAPLVVRHRTHLNAPNGINTRRTTVGVGETVHFSSNMAGNWQVSGGAVAEGKPTPLDMAWRAPGNSGPVNITFRSGNQSRTIQMKVVAPKSIIARKERTLSYPSGVAGAGMMLRFRYLPLDVSFRNIETSEVSGPPAGYGGYFSRFSSAMRKHDAHEAFTGVREDNYSRVLDQASLVAPKPWAAGNLEWRIPNKYRVAGDFGDGTQFTTVSQTFSITDNGTVSVSKAGQNEQRAPY